MGEVTSPDVCRRSHGIEIRECRDELAEVLIGQIFILMSIVSSDIVWISKIMLLKDV
jgi:hypothetical protein